MELGDRIKELRDEREMSLTALEEASGVSKAYLSQLERGVASNPSIDSLGKIARALGIRMVDLIGEEHAEKILIKDLPQGLQDLIKRSRGTPRALRREDIEMLNRIHYRGARPKSAEDWAYLLESIRRSVRR